jgi:hypothetical protein
LGAGDLTWYVDSQDFVLGSKTPVSLPPFLLDEDHLHESRFAVVTVRQPQLNMEKTPTKTQDPQNTTKTFT